MTPQRSNWPAGREELEALLRRHSIQPTRQRLEIAEILFERPQHLSADQILERARSQGAVVSKATVYNTLAVFAERGLVREVIVDPTRAFYDSNTSDHYHLFNVDRGTLTDIPAGAVQVNGMPQLPPGTRLDGIQVVIRVREEGGDA